MVRQARRRWRRTLTISVWCVRVVRVRVVSVCLRLRLTLVAFSTVRTDKYTGSMDSWAVPFSVSLSLAIPYFFFDMHRLPSVLSNALHRCRRSCSYESNLVGGSVAVVNTGPVPSGGASSSILPATSLSTSSLPLSSSLHRRRSRRFSNSASSSSSSSLLPPPPVFHQPRERISLHVPLLRVNGSGGSAQSSITNGSASDTAGAAAPSFVSSISSDIPRISDYKAILSDFDGTLACSDEVHLASYNAVLIDHKFAAITDSEYSEWSHADDTGLFRMCLQARGASFTAEDLAALVARKRKLASHFAAGSHLLYPRVQVGGALQFNALFFLFLVFDCVL